MKKLLVLFFVKKALLFALLFVPVFASAAPAFSAKMGQAVGGVMERKAIQRGFAANDPRFNSAIAATAAVLTTAATGAVAAAGAPLWVTIGLGALAAGAVSLALDAAVSWYFNGDGTVTYTVAGTGGVPGKLTRGQPYYSTCAASTWQQGCYNATTPSAAAVSYFLDWTGGNPAWGAPPSQCESTGPTSAQCWTPGNKAGSLVSIALHASFSGDCASGQVANGSSCVTVSIPGTGPSQQTKKPDLAVDDLTPEQKALPVDPKIIADIANQAWQQAAAQPGYQGLPYSYTDPVTVADVQAWQAANPSAYPTVGDAVSSAVNPSTGTVPVTTPGQATNPTPGIPTAPEGTPKLDLGIDPGIGSPNLEPTPTGAQILAPITGLMPDLKNFQVPAHQGECPKPEFDIAVLHTRVRMDAQCTLFEEVRGPLYNGSLVAWIIAALFIVLSA